MSNKPFILEWLISKCPFIQGVSDILKTRWFTARETVSATELVIQSLSTARCVSFFRRMES